MTLGYFPFYGLTDFSRLPLLVLLIIFDLVLKGFALWQAGRNKQLYWFIALLILNTVGILPIIYLLAFRKKRK